VSLLSFCEWLASTHWSVALHESHLGYPLVESIHVLTLCVFVGMSMMLDLRLLGLTLRDVPFSEVADRLMPWMIGGFVVMVVSGALLFYAIPVRSYQNIFFRVKMILLVLAGVNAWVFQKGVYRRLASWDRDASPPRRARIAGGASLVLWVAIIVAGRMIAYNWFDCNTQIEGSAMYWAAGCTPGNLDDLNNP